MNAAFFTLSGFVSGIFLVLLFFVLVVVSAGILKRFTRRGGPEEKGGRQTLEQWARSIKFSSTQLTAMRSIWHAFKAGRLGDEVDPFRHLNPQEMADLLKKCSFEALPPELRRSAEQRERQNFMQGLEERGLDPVQAEVITGMKFGKLGPACEV